MCGVSFPVCDAVCFLIVLQVAWEMLTGKCPFENITNQMEVWQLTTIALLMSTHLILMIIMIKGLTIFQTCCPSIVFILYHRIQLHGSVAFTDLITLLML